MAISPKNNQALGFDIAAEGCGCGGRYCQPIQGDDSMQLQITVSAANNNNLCENGEFSSAPGGWTLNGNFTISADKLNSGTYNGNEAISPYMGLTADRIYLIQTKVTVTGGAPGANLGWYIKANGDYLQLPDSIPLAGGYNESLSASWLYKPSSIVSDDIRFGATTNGIIFTVDYVRVYEFSAPGIALYDNSDNLLSATSSFTGDNALKYVRNSAEILTGVNKSELFEGEFAYNGVSVSANMFIDNWDSLTTYRGCMYAVLFDATYQVNRIRNGTFVTDLQFWTVGDNWAWEGATEKAEYTPDGMTAGNLSQSIILPGGTTYTLSFNLTGLAFNEDMSLFIDTGSGAVTTVVTGTQLPYTHTIDLSAFTGLVTVIVAFGEGPGADHYLIDNVSVLADGYVGNTSACMDLQTTHTCTLLLMGNNNDDAFGFEEGVGFRQWLRIDGKKKLFALPEEVKGPFRFSDGSHSLLYAQQDTEYEIIVADAPEYIHQCASKLRLMDIFQIDGTDYVRSGDYNIVTRKSSDLIQARFGVLVQQGVTANYSCD